MLDSRPHSVLAFSIALILLAGCSDNTNGTFGRKGEDISERDKGGRGDGAGGDDLRGELDGRTSDASDGSDVDVDADGGPKPIPSECGGVPLVMMPPGVDGSTVMAGTTVAMGDSSVTDRAACDDGDSARWGDGLPDRRVGFVAKESGNYRFEVSADFNAMLTVTEGCPAPVVDSCEAWSRPPHPRATHGVDMQLEAGKLYVVTIDGALEDMPEEAHLYTASFGVGFLPRVVDEVMDPMVVVLRRARDLAIESGGDGYTDTERAVFDASFQSWMDYLKVFPEVATLKSIPLLTGQGGDGGLIGFWAGSVEVADGRRDVDLQALSYDDGLYLIGESVDGLANAQGALDNLNAGIDLVLRHKALLKATALVLTGALERRQGTFEVTTIGPCVDACPASPSCVLNCTGKECGADGCGGSCGVCAEDDTCGLGACLAKPTEQCQDDCLHSSCAIQPVTLQCGETLEDQSLSLLPSRLVYALEPPTSEKKVTVRTRGLFAYPRLVAHAYLAELSCDSVNLLFSSEGAVSFPPVPGAHHYIELGSWNNMQETADAFGPFAFPPGVDPLAFDIEVTCCVPNCEGKSCGSDGCGGTCNYHKCSYCNGEGHCGMPPGSCLPGLPLTCGETQTGINLDSSMMQRPDGVSPYAHLAFTLTPVESGPVTLSLDAPQWTLTGLRVADFDGLTCEQASEVTTPLALGIGSLTFEAEAGRDYRVYVEDTWGTHLLPRPTFNLAVQCPN